MTLVRPWETVETTEGKKDHSCALCSNQLFAPDLDHALICLQREDPSLKVKIDANTGQVRFTMLIIIKLTAVL